MPLKLEIASPPHIRSRFSSQGIMGRVLIALIFPSAAAVYFFGWPALTLIVFTTAVCVVWEMVFQWLARRPIFVLDGSAAVTGILLALVLPPTLPLWIAAIGAFVAIVVTKGLFGGLGFNIFNPALAARAFLLASWPLAVTNWIRPFDAVTTATPLYLVNKLGENAPSYWNLFIGNRGGSLGETSVLAILIGGGLLLACRIIDWPAPTAFIGSTALLTWLLGHDPLFGIMSGGLMLGAFFMATDYVTTPVTTNGRFLFGLGCGVITVLIRYFGGFPEGVNYSILLMNILTPIIDRQIRPTVFGWSLSTVLEAREI